MGRRQDFEAALQSLKTELILDVNRTDVLDKEKMDGLQREYNQKLVNVQVQFLKMLSSADSKVSVELTKPTAGTINDAGIITLAGLVAGVVVCTLSFATLWTITNENTIWFDPWVLIFGPKTIITTTPVTLATLFAGLLGVSTVIASGILTVGIGVIAGLAMYWCYYHTWRKRLREKLLEDFDTKILPKLRDWADGVINKTQA